MVIYFSFIFLFLVMNSVSSVEIDGSLGDSEGLKESGSKKRYGCSFYFGAYLRLEKEMVPGYFKLIVLSDLWKP